MTEIAKTAFYSNIIEMLQKAEKSIDLYSVSCCFGFFTHGLHNFRDVYVNIQDALERRRDNKYLDVRVLVKVDNENQIDSYAASRFENLQNNFLNTPGINGRIIFKELHEKCNPVRFIIVDGEEILFSHIQKSRLDRDLNIILNESSPGERYFVKECPDLHTKYSQLFLSEWERCDILGSR